MKICPLTIPLVILLVEPQIRHNNTHTKKIGNIHIREDSLGPPLVFLRSQDREGSAIYPQKIHMTQNLLGELISPAKVQTEP